MSNNKHYIVTDTIHGKQYSFDNVKKAYEQFEKCVTRARKNLIELTKCENGYKDDDGFGIYRNRDKEQRIVLYR